MTLSINSPAFKGTLRIADGNLDRLSTDGDEIKTTTKEDVLEINKITKMLSNPEKVGYISSMNGGQKAQFKVMYKGTPHILDINTSKNGAFNFAIYNKDSKGYELTIYQKELEDNAKTYRVPLKNFFEKFKEARLTSPKVTTYFEDILTPPPVKITSTEVPVKMEKWAQKLRAMSSCSNPEKLEKAAIELKRWGENTLKTLRNLINAPKKHDSTEQSNNIKKPVLEELEKMVPAMAEKISEEGSKKSA